MLMLFSWMHGKWVDTELLAMISDVPYETFLRLACSCEFEILELPSGKIAMQFDHLTERIGYAPGFASRN